MKNNPHNKSILCPRCGYNLRGITQTWQTTGSCPLQGKCSECGLDFDWQRVFRESEHPWLFEIRYKHHPYSSFIKTILMTFRPRRFWRDIDMTDSVHLGPLFFMPIFLGVVLIILRFGIAIWSYNNARLWYSSWNPIGGTFSISGLLKYWFHDSSWYWSGQMLPVFGVITLTCMAWSFFIIAFFAFLPASRHRYKIRKAHLIRVGLYIFLPIIFYLIAWALVDVILIILHERFKWSITVADVLTLFGLFYIVGIGGFIWLTIGWFHACRDYLKLPHAFWIALLLTTASSLIILLIHIIWWSYQIQQPGRVQFADWEYRLFNW